MQRSLTARILTVSALALVMYIPMVFVSDVVDARLRHAGEVERTLSAEWGGDQTLIGPILEIPVEKTVATHTTKRTVDPETGDWTTRQVAGEVTRPAASLRLLPDRYVAEATAKTQIRARGLFEVPVYTAEITIDFTLPATAPPIPGETVLWDQARLIFAVTDPRGLRGDVSLTRAGEALTLEPAARQEGLVRISADPGDLSDAAAYRLRLSLNGARTLSLTPMGRVTRAQIDSAWPHPSFTGAFLPDAHQTGDDGFSAAWTIPHLARAMPQTARTDILAAAAEQSFGVRFHRPADVHQRAWRTARYAILFIALTFLTVLLIETRGAPAHPLHYGLIGMAQGVFVLLMVSYAEQIGFGPAYLASSAATVGLITLFAWKVLAFGGRSLVLAGVLGALYGALFLILRSADYALLAGASISFLAVAAAMFGIGRDGLGDGSLRLPRLRRAAPPAQDTPPAPGL